MLNKILISRTDEDCSKYNSQVTELNYIFNKTPLETRQACKKESDQMLMDYRKAKVIVDALRENKL
jgi:hypothetical protein